MPRDDLRTMQRDLDAVRAALDLDGETVDNARGHALSAVAGLMTLAWGALAPSSLQLWGLVAGALLLPAQLASPVIVIAGVLTVAGAVGAAIARYSEGR